MREQFTARSGRLVAAGEPSTLRLTGCGERIELAAEADGSAKLKRFSMTAYTGGAMRIQGFFYPVVVDLQGGNVPRQSNPVLRGHDSTQIVGHTDSVEVSAKRIKATGLISGVGDAAQEVLATAANGFPWQTSIGTSIEKLEFVDVGQPVKVNGSNFNGPCYVVRAWTLGEISFVPMGADAQSSAVVAVGTPGVIPMSFEHWLIARGFSLATLSESDRTRLQAQFDAERQPTPPSPTPAPAAPPVVQATAPVQPPAPIPDPAIEMRRLAAAESQRIADIRRLCAANPVTITVGTGPQARQVALEAHAIAENWNTTQVELEQLRAARPAGGLGFAVGRTETAEPAVLEAALMLAGNLQRPERFCSQQALEAAQRRYPRHIGLQQMLLEAAWEGGYTGRHFERSAGGMRNILRAAFSTAAISGILSNVANKFLLQGFMAVESVWQAIASRRAVNDFKTVTSYRMTGAMQFEIVSPTGELHHADVSEESYTNKADTYGKIFNMTRTDMINDDLGALNAIPMKIGRGGALKLNDVFWTEFLADAGTFYSVAHANYFSGSTTNLQSSSLTTALQKFRDQVDADSKPLGITPRILLVPTALEVTALELMRSISINTGGSSSTDKVPNINIWGGMFSPAVSAYLGNSSYTGYSATAWYLIASPDDLSSIEICFLNGQEQPTVEEVELAAETLGIGFRGYFDFGVNKQDYRAAVKSKGGA